MSAQPPLIAAQCELGGAVARRRDGTWMLWRDGAMRPATVHDVVRAANHRRAVRWRRWVLARAAVLLGDRLAVRGQALWLSGRPASLARVAELAQALDRETWPAPPPPIRYPGLGA